MTQRMKPNPAHVTVLGTLIERARREHQLTTATLAMLSGLSDEQVRAIEEGNASVFVNHAHHVDCARRISVAMGLPDTHFLQMQASAASPQRVIRQTLPSSSKPLSRDAWEHLPEAHLNVLAKVRTIDAPSAPEQRRQGSPMVIALLVALILAALMLGLTLLH